MNNDYILEKKRNEAKNILNASTGGNEDIIIFSKNKRIIRALEELRIFWCEIDGEIYVNRHEVEDII